MSTAGTGPSASAGRASVPTISWPTAGIERAVPLAAISSAAADIVEAGTPTSSPATASAPNERIPVRAMVPSSWLIEDYPQR